MSVAYSQDFKSRSRTTRLLQSPIGGAMTGWWVDGPALHTVTRLMFPLNRMWAAANLVGTDVERFADTVPARFPARAQRQIERGLERIATTRDAFENARAAHRELFWGAGSADEETLVAAEDARLAASDRYMASRLAFWSLRLRTRIPAVRDEVWSPERLFDRFESAIADPAEVYGLPDLPDVQASRALTINPTRRDYWLTYRSPSPFMNDIVTARVREPIGVDNPPTLIFGSGVGIDTDLSTDPINDYDHFIARGVRVVELETPWHSNRCLEGWWSGEPFFGQAPFGPIALFSAEAFDFATLTRWARGNSTGAVGIGGVSLGALAAQMAACNADLWPTVMRPDVMFLVTVADGLDRMVYDSAMARTLGMRKSLEKHGWTRELMARLRPIADPVRPPAMKPEDIVMVLGTKDTVTPFERGMACAKAWGVPSENLFVSRRGHFSAPLNTIRDHSAVDRVAARLQAGA